MSIWWHSTCSRANISYAQNTLLYDSHNQAAACESEKRRALRRNVPKGHLVLLHHNKIPDASQVLNLGTGGCGCAHTGLAVIEMSLSLTFQNLLCPLSSTGVSPREEQLLRGTLQRVAQPTSVIPAKTPSAPADSSVFTSPSRKISPGG